MRPARPALLAATLTVGLGALAGCSGSSSAAPTGTADGTGLVATASGTAQATSPAATGGAASATSGSATATGTATASGPGPKTKVGKKITDPALGHTITVHQIQRDWPWPSGYAIPSQVFELVAVEMTWEVGDIYTAWLSPDMFTIDSGSKFPNVVDSVIDPELKDAGYTMLPSKVTHGKTARGWLVFKVDPKDAKQLKLTYTRPKIDVSGGSDIPRKTFTVALTG